MNKKVFIDVPEPCHENWQEMTPVEQGRHCGVCTKKVIDFTKFSDKKLLDFLSMPQQNVCGRFNNKQLNREITTSLEAKKYSLPTTWLFGLSLLAGTIATTLPINSYASTTVTKESIFKIKSEKTEDDTIRTVRGVVLDSLSSEPLIGALVKIKNTKIGVATNLDGRFVIKIPENYASKKITLEVRYIGYSTKYIVVSKKNHLSNIALSEAPVNLKIDLNAIEHCTTMGIIGYDSNEQKQSIKVIKRERKIFGSVLSKEDGSPLIEATISIQGTKYKAETDFKGNFSFNFPPSYFDSTFTLEIKMIGYSTLLITDYRYKYAKEPLFVKLRQSETIIIGSFYKPTRWQRVKGFFRRPF